jgi:hypothetical protein
MSYDDATPDRGHAACRLAGSDTGTPNGPPRPRAPAACTGGTSGLLQWLSNLEFRPLFVALVFAVVATASRAAPGLAPLDIYSGRMMVSGQGEANRSAGFSACLVDVLLKVSGDPTVATDPRVHQIAAHAADYVSGYSYRDRYQGRPLHDEQGSYDRPHYLTVAFDPVRIAEALRSVGRSPWTGERPRVLVVLSVQNRKASFLLASDADVDVSADMRAALGDASERTAIPYAVPDRATLTSAGIITGAPAALIASGASAIAIREGVSATLIGDLRWSEADHGWVASWHLRAPAGEAAWEERGVNFDEAFREGFRGVAQIYSGHGSPTRP